MSNIRLLIIVFSNLEMNGSTKTVLRNIFKTPLKDDSRVTTVIIITAVGSFLEICVKIIFNVMYMLLNIYILFSNIKYKVNPNY